MAGNSWTTLYYNFITPKHEVVKNSTHVIIGTDPRCIPSSLLKDLDFLFFCWVQS